MMNAAINPAALPPIIPTERKRKHKLTEQRGRQKINSQINDLKNLLPECKYVITTKASILECAVNSLTRLQTLCNQLMVYNKRLQKENRKLHAELDRLRESGVMVLPIQSDDEEDGPLPDDNQTLNGTPAGFDPQLAASVGVTVPAPSPPSNNAGSFVPRQQQQQPQPQQQQRLLPQQQPQPMIQQQIHHHQQQQLSPHNVASNLMSMHNNNIPLELDPLNNAYLASLGLTNTLLDAPSLATTPNPAMDPFLIDYCSSPGVTSPHHSTSPPSSSPPFSPLSPIENSFRFDDPSLFLGTTPSPNNPMMPPTSSSSSTGGYTTDFDPSGFARFTKRRLLFIFLFMMPFFFSFDSLASISSPSVVGNSNRILLGFEYDENKAVYYWDLLRLIWYVVGGTLGVSWVLNTFIWATQLADEKDMNGSPVASKKKKNTTGNATREAANFIRKGATQPLRRKIVM